MFVNIKAVVDNLKNIGIKSVIFEAIANAIQANATIIDVKIYTANLIENDASYIDKMEIVDNGEGFIESNLNAFKEYLTEHHKTLGCKGIGRFTYLKYFKNIQITSQNVKINFDERGVKSEYINQFYNTTNILFLDVKESIYVDFKTIIDDTKEHFLALFQLRNEKLQLNFYKNDKFMGSVANTNIPNFAVKEFKIKEYIFKLSYLCENIKFKNEAFYAANHRVVIKNSQLKQEEKYNLPKDNDIKIFFILESEYFDNNVNYERNELQIYPLQKNTLQFQDLNWNDIYEGIEKELKQIYKQHNFDIDEKIKENRKKSVNDLPYLGSYFIDRDELNLNDMKNKAQKEFKEDKEYLRDVKNINHKDYETKLSKVTQAELAEYIFDRERLISTLKQSVKNEDIEQKIHNLFIAQKTNSENLDYKSNNLWLFDDRFMSYNKIFSDIQMKEIFPQLSTNLERPDILSIISNTYEKDKITDILLIELKRPADSITPAQAEEQLLKYARYINHIEQENKIRIWAYAFLKFSNETMEALQDKSYNKIFSSNSYPICYKYYEQNNIIINFMDYGALISDAENRNQLFLDILRGKYIKQE